MRRLIYILISAGIGLSLILYMANCTTETRLDLLYYEYHNDSPYRVEIEASVILMGVYLTAKESRFLEGGQTHTEFIDKSGGENSPGLLLQNANHIRLIFEDGCELLYCSYDDKSLPDDFFDRENYKYSRDRSSNEHMLYVITEDHYHLARNLNEFDIKDE